MSLPSLDGGRRWAAALGVVCLLAGAATARGDVLVNDSQAVSSGAPPVQHALLVANAATLEVDVADLAFPAAMASFSVAVTQGGTIIKTISATGNATFSATPGQYVIWVVGQPDATSGAGNVSVSVINPSDPAPQTPLTSFVATLQVPGVGALQSQVDYPLVVPAAGDYTVALADQSFPQALSALAAAVFYGANLVAPISPGTPVVLTNLAATTPGAAAQYKITVIAAAAPSAGGGLYGIRMAGGPGNQVVIDRTAPVGVVTPPKNVVVPIAGSITLQVADLQFPAALTSVGAMLTDGSTVVAQRTTPGSAAAMAGAGSLQLWRFATSTSSAGGYQLAVDEGASNLYTDTQGVSALVAGGAVEYAYPLVLGSAGSYNAVVTDFQFPASLQSVQFAVAQNGQVLQQAAAPGSLTFGAVAGPAALLVTAKPPAGGTGLFGANIFTTDSSPTVLLDKTQSVGGVFDTQEVIVLAAGRYDVTLADGQWPAPFGTLALVLTSNGQLIGKIYGGGTFAFDAVPGRYLTSFIATPAPSQTAGFYSLNVQSSVPTVSLSADPTAIQAGQGVRLTWSSTGATACTGSGGWTGSQSTSGTSVAKGPLSADTTFTLVCTGPGGTSAPASVKITVTPPSGGSGGGGSVDPAGLAVLGLLVLIRRKLLRRKAVGRPACGAWQTPQR